MRRSIAFAAVLVTASLCSHPSLAQQGPDRQFVAPREPRQSIAVPEPALDLRAPAGAATYRFVLRQLSITGSSLYVQSDLLAEPQKKIGTEVGLDDIYRMAADLTLRHRQAGYILTVVTVPAQNIVDGRVTLRITEGFLEDVEFEGEPAEHLPMLDKVRSRLLASRPLSHSVLERELLLLNDIPGLLAQSSLLPSSNEIGGSRLIVRLSRQVRTEFAAGVNNRGTEMMGPMQADASATFNALLSSRDQTTLRVVSTGTSNELLYIAASHQQAISSRGTTLGLRTSWSQSDPPLQNSLPQLSLETQSMQFGIDLAHPLLRGRRANVSARVGLTHHRGRTEFPFFGVDLTNDRLTAVRLGLSIDGADTRRGINMLDLEFSKGLKGLGASKLGDPAASRLGGRPDFSKATAYAARLQSIGPLGSRWSMLLAATGQYAFNNLLSAEEFAFGGEFFGRAYDPSELVGDTGYAAKLELRFAQNFGPRISTTFYAFGESGSVYRRINPQDVSDQRDSARSIGAGVRFDVWSSLSGYVEFAKPMGRDVAAEGNDEGRAFGGIRYRF